MNKFIAVLFIALIAVSCDFGLGKKQPEGILSNDQLVEVLVDVHIADAALTTLALQRKDDTFKSSDFYQRVLEKHDVTREQFDNSMDYYSKKPLELEKIYDRVLTELSKRKADLITEDEQKSSE